MRWGEPGLLFPDHLLLRLSYIYKCYICFLVNAFKKSKKNVCFPFVEDNIDDNFYMFWLGGDGMILDSADPHRLEKFFFTYLP